jgi:hypothetical protein
MVHPTTDTQTFFDRFDKRFIAQFRLLRRIWPQVLAINKRKKELGITDSSDPTTAWKDSVKLINNIFGLMAARPIGPLVQAVGPIIPSKYEAPSGDLKHFLEGHKRLAYVAFGQNATPSDDDIRLILAALMKIIESGELDGFIWATVITGRGLFPEYVTTSSNKKYSVSDMFNDKNPDIRFVQWAPQAAILFHPSTTLFISHGGLNSWSESLYAGVPIVMYPFFGDQPANSKLNEQANLGATLNPYKTVEETTDLLKKVIKDEDGEIEKALKRYQALIQIHSSHGIINGADIIEEVAFVNVDGKLPHRYPASRKMNYFKAHDLDIYAFLISIILGFLVTLYYTTKLIFNIIVSKTSLNEKPKNQ